MQADSANAKVSYDFGYRVTLKRRGPEKHYVGEYSVGDAVRAHFWMNSLQAK
jgi:hypothetical protein